MVSYPKSVEKHTSNISYNVFKLYCNIFVPSWVDLDPYSWPKRGVEANFKLSKKVSMTPTSSPSSFCWNASNNIPYMV